MMFLKRIAVASAAAGLALTALAQPVLADNDWNGRRHHRHHHRDRDHYERPGPVIVQPQGYYYVPRAPVVVQPRPVYVPQPTYVVPMGPPQFNIVIPIR